MHVNPQERFIDPENESLGKTTDMRGAGATAVVSHNANLNVLPVYEVTTGGHLGSGDRVTLLDDHLSAGSTIERVIKHSGGLVGGYLVSFREFLPADPALRIKRGTLDTNARMVKFPSNRYRRQRVVSIGAPVSGGGSRAEAAIGCVRLGNYMSGNSQQRLKQAIDAASGGGFDCIFGRLSSLFSGGTEWGWAASDHEFGVASWPLKGYIQLGGEALCFKVRYPHSITYSTSLGAVTGRPGVSVKGGDIPATGNIVWQREAAEDVDPIRAGFNPYGGYLVIISFQRSETAGTTKSLENCNNEVLQWLIDKGHVTQEFVDQHGTWDEAEQKWTFEAITTEGGFNTTEKREFVFYQEINPKTPDANQYTFTCDDDGRHLYSTHMDGATPLGHTTPSDSPAPTLHGRTVALTVLQRGGATGTLGLGTSAAAHPAGSRLLPLPNIPVTLLNGPPVDEDGNPAVPYEGERLPVEDHAAFPESGYIELTRSTGAREIIYYTHKTEETITDSDPERKQYYLCGIRRFRGRFGTKPIDLTGLNTFGDVRNTSSAQVAAYQDTRRIVKLFRPRFPDRMPLAISMSGDNELSRAYAPYPSDTDPLYFEVKKTVRGARWLSVDWTEQVPDNTDVIVLVRVGHSPSWATAEPVPWDSVPSGGGRVIIKCEEPRALAGDNAINMDGDTITVRVYFKSKSGYDLSAWQVPVVKSLTLRYQAGPRVVESQELRY